MNIKKALFGGYKRKVVDQMVTQWTEEKESTQSRIEMMEIELSLTNETAKRSVEQLNADIKLKEKSIELLRGELEQKKALAEQLAGVVETRNAQIADLSAQVEQKDRLINNQELNTADTVPAGRSVHNDAAYDEGIRRIGQLYVDAKNYTDMIKSDAQIKTNEAVDLFFEEISNSREEYLAINNQINQKRRAISELTYEMEGTLKLLRNNLAKFDDKPSISEDPYVKLDEIREKLKDRINNGFNPFTFSHEEIIPATTTETADTKAKTVDNDEVENRLAEFALQVDELRSALQKQQEIIDSQTVIQEKAIAHEQIQQQEQPKAAFQERDTNTVQVKHIAIETDTNAAQNVVEQNPNPTSQPINTEYTQSKDDEPLSLNESDIVDEPAVEDTSDKEPVNPERVVAEPRITNDSQPDEHELRSERERTEREKYRLYFSEIEKKYKRDSTGGHRYTFSNSHSAGDTHSNSSDSYSDGTPNSDNKTVKLENKSTRPATSGETSGNHGKKPSIKEILDKYANLK